MFVYTRGTRTKHLYFYAGDKNAKIVIDFCHPATAGAWSIAERGGSSQSERGQSPPKQKKQIPLEKHIESKKLFCWLTPLNNLFHHIGICQCGNIAQFAKIVMGNLA